MIEANSPISIFIIHKQIWDKRNFNVSPQLLWHNKIRDFIFLIFFSPDSIVSKDTLKCIFCFVFQSFFWLVEFLQVSWFMKSFQSLRCWFYSIDENEACQTPNRKDGKCILFRECSPLFSLVQIKPVSDENKKLIMDSQCGTRERRPLICCPESQETLSKNLILVKFIVVIKRFFFQSLQLLAQTRTTIMEPAKL